MVSKSKKDKYIDEKVTKTLTIYNSVCPKFYGLPKIHKPTLSFRQIIAFIDAPTDKLISYQGI